VKVAIADDSVLLRDGLTRMLTAHGIEVVGVAGDGAGIESRVAALNPDAVILDVRMPPTFTDEGIATALSIRDKYSTVGVLVLSQFVETAWAMRLLENGVGGIGYLLKDRVTQVEDLIEALERVAAGGSVIDPMVVERLVARKRDHDPLGSLTPRELEVLQLMAEGRSNGAIGELLFLGLKTVETHVSSILLKLQIPVSTSDNRRVLAVLAYLRNS
jgi:DNA-binding NarL/FixJ family response regulator